MNYVGEKQFLLQESSSGVRYKRRTIESFFFFLVS